MLVSVFCFFGGEKAAEKGKLKNHCINSHRLLWCVDVCLWYGMLSNKQYGVWCYDGCEDEIIIKIKEGGQKPLKERQTRPTTICFQMIGHR